MPASVIVCAKSPALELGRIDRGLWLTNRAAEADGALVTARDNYFMAAQYWASAQWPMLENCAAHLRLNRQKHDCFAAYARLADHRVEAAWIPLSDGRKLPGDLKPSQAEFSAEKVDSARDYQGGGR